MDSGAKITDHPDKDFSPNVPDLEAPTRSFAEAITIGLSEEEQAQLFREPNIGPYRIIRQIGQGGMGAVYLAERDDQQFKKQVAIKLVKRGMDTEFVLRRFLSERQILAALDHPNIARLLDGGTTADGRPYFVMEYIEGKPIAQYADEKKLTTVERLNLFRKVCSAVHYAHQNLVIHRDIKPSNILVTADGEPKLLDFGIAKLLNPELADQTVEATATVVRLLTPEYASPEQARGEQITTATDIYSLGVVLYELLTGHRPYLITSRLPHEIARVICEQEPQRPSTAVVRSQTISTPTGQTVTVTPEEVSRTREGQPDKLRRKLRGDLDNIILMAMRKEPQRRYSSVDQLSNDIRRHIEGLPVIARKDTFAYRSAKFIKRNKAGAIAALLILLTLIGGFIATSIERARAERLFNDVRQLANSFMFEIHDAIENLPGATAARELLVKRALEYLDSLSEDAVNDPSLQRERATAYQKVGDVQGNPYNSNLGDTAGALESYRKALAIREKLVASNPSNLQDKVDLATTYSRMGDVLWTIGDTKPALEAYSKAVALGEELIAVKPDDVEISRRLWTTYRRYGYAQAQAGDFDSGVKSFNRARELNERVVAANSGDTEARRDQAANYTAMGVVLGETGNLTGARDYFLKALAIYEEMASADPTNAQFKREVAVSLGDLGDVLDRMGDYQGAVNSFRKAMPILELLASDSNDAAAQRNLAVFYMRIGRSSFAMGKHADALAAYRKAAAILEALPQTGAANLQGRGDLAMTFSRMGLTFAKTADAAAAFDYANKGRAIAEELMAASPANIELRGLTALAYTTLGDVNATIASGEKKTDKQIALWRDAREWYQKSFEILSDLKSRNEWVSSDYGSPEQLQQKIAESDAAIAKLRK